MVDIKELHNCKVNGLQSRDKVHGCKKCASIDKKCGELAEKKHHTDISIKIFCFLLQLTFYPSSNRERLSSDFQGYIHICHLNGYLLMLSYFPS